MKVHVLNHQQHDIVVHRVGCADIERERRKGKLNSDWLLDIPEGKDIAAAVAADVNEGFGWPNPDDPDEPEPWPASMIRVMPCVKGTK